MALSEYMPYGAPDLLADAPARMARSTLFASITVAVLVSGLGAIVSRSAGPIPIDKGPEISIDLIQLPEPIVHDRPIATPTRPTFDSNALPVPVPDVRPPTVEVSSPLAPDGPVGDAARTNSSARGEPTAVGLVEEDPKPGEFHAFDVFPAVVTSREPRYPDFAREAGVEGVVRVLMLVGLDGRVERAVVAPGARVSMFDEAALAAARGCVFTPALMNNHPVKAWVGRSYRFTLH